jgi:hypothetical protein
MALTVATADDVSNEATTSPSLTHSGHSPNGRAIIRIASVPAERAEKDLLPSALISLLKTTGQIVTCVPTSTTRPVGI